MGGGKGNIKPEDGKQFEKGNNAAEKWTEEEALKLGNDMLKWFKAENENIFFEDFLYLSCNESDYAGSIYKELPAYLSKKFSSFLNILDKCREIEKIKLKKFGALNKLNANIVKFLLSAEYGLTDKINLDHTSDGKELKGFTIEWGDKKIDI